MKITILLLFGLAVLPCKTLGQSFELMTGSENMFLDVQWLSTFEHDSRLSLFSRTRATDNYENSTNLFSGAYLNFTSKSGVGGTVVGRIASSGSGLDAGVHYFKANKELLIYALASFTLVNSSGLSWFSITRYTPPINAGLKFYTSLELFSSVDFSNHTFSTQRIRLGLSRGPIQFGLAANFSQVGSEFSQSERNPGAFLRTQF